MVLPSSGRKPGVPPRTPHDVDALLDQHTSGIATLGTRVDGAESDVAALAVTDTGLQTQITALGADIDAIATAPTDLPAIPDLYAHWDATTISAADGSRVASWLDETTGKDAAQATSGNQPRYDISAFNGKPAVYFENARNDNLRATGLAPASQTVTMFAVIKATPGTGNRFIFATDGSTKSLLVNNIDGISMQTTGATLLQVESLNMERPHIIAGRRGAVDSSLRIDGTELETGSSGTGAVAQTQFTLGHRDSLTAGQGLEGHIGELLYYERELTENEIAAVETYLAAKWDIVTTPQAVWYLDSVAGDDGNDGRKSTKPMATLSAVAASIHGAGDPDATVLIRAPRDTPLRETAGVVFPYGGTVRLQSQTPGVPWYCYGSTRVEGGWTDAGGGVYSRTITMGADAWYVVVPDLLDTDGQATRIYTDNTATPTTPAAGEAGYSGGALYIHLPDDANPNSYAVEICQASVVLWARGDTTLVIDDAVIRYGRVACVRSGSTSAAPDGYGMVYASDCIAEYAATAWQTSGETKGMRLERCEGNGCQNDGFNIHGAVGNTAITELIDCEGAYNLDEGVSPHDDTRLILRGGRYHHNGHGGLTSVGNAVTQLFDVEFDHNRLHDAGVTGWDKGGVAILETSTLTSTDLYSHDHPGPGVEIDTAGGATWTDYGGTRSGIANGNGAEDSV